MDWDVREPVEVLTLNTNLSLYFFFRYEIKEIGDLFEGKIHFLQCICLVDEGKALWQWCIHCFECQIFSITMRWNSYIISESNFVCLIAARVLWDNIEPIFFNWCKRLSEVFTRRPIGESNRECHGDSWDSQSPTSVHTWKWWCPWRQTRADCVARWPYSKKALPYNWVFSSYCWFPSPGYYIMIVFRMLLCFIIHDSLCCFLFV